MAQRLGWIIFCLVFAAGCASTPKPVDNGREGLIDKISNDMAHARSLEPPVSALTPEVAHPVHSVTGIKFRWPLKEIAITSPFGKRGDVFHEGIDLRAKPGTPVFAAYAGTVLYADRRIRGYGQMVVIRHKGGVATVYAHNQQILVRAGEVVKQGQQIALSGNTGHSVGPHLHFEVRKGVEPLNPEELLPQPKYELPLKTKHRRRHRRLG